MGRLPKRPGVPAFRLGELLHRECVSQAVRLKVDWGQHRQNDPHCPPGKAPPGASSSQEGALPYQVLLPSEVGSRGHGPGVGPARVLCLQPGGKRGDARKLCRGEPPPPVAEKAA